MTTKGRLKYVCHVCETEHIQATPSCQQCGPGATGRFHLDPLNGQVTLLCDGCGQTQSSLDSPAIDCVTCHRGSNDWWDENQSTWFNLKLSVSPEDSQGTWVCGDFDGDYVGILKPTQRHSTGLTGQPVFYDIHFTRGYLKNVRKLDGPPQHVAQNEVRPFTEPLVFPVDIQTAQTDEAPACVSRVGLKNFRLHQWSQTADHDGAAGSQVRRHGRLTGIAYGILDESKPPQRERPKPESLQNSPRTAPGERVQSSAPHTAGAAENKTEHDNTSFEEAENTEIENSCLICSWLFQLMLFGLTWLACTLKVAGLFWLFMALGCWLDSTTLRQNLRFKNKWGLLIVGLLLLLLSGAGLTIGYWPDFVHDCQTLAQNALLVSAGAWLFSTLLRSCFVKTTLLVFVLVALTTWCKTHDRACKFIPATHSFAISAGHLAQQLSIFTDSDVNSTLINDVGQNNPNGQRISLDQANDHIELLDDCKNRIYIPFGFNSSELDSETETKLYRLGQLLQRYAPERIIISGYTSKNLGDETPQGFLHNIKLSEQRTETVRQYLATNEFIEDRKIETRGYGYNVPILPRDPAHDINRRVEVNIQCPLGPNGKE